jgi:NADPH2:quinone reductase
MRELIGWQIAGKIKPVIEGTYPLAEAKDVLRRIHDRAVAGKLILKP